MFFLPFRNMSKPIVLTPFSTHDVFFKKTHELACITENISNFAFQLT